MSFLRNMVFGPEEAKVISKDEKKVLNDEMKKISDALAKDFAAEQGTTATTRGQMLAKQQQQEARQRLEARAAAQQAQLAQQSAAEDLRRLEMDKIRLEADMKAKTEAKADFARDPQERAETYLARRLSMAAFVNQIQRDIVLLKKAQHDAVDERLLALETDLGNLLAQHDEIHRAIMLTAEERDELLLERVLEPFQAEDMYARIQANLRELSRNYMTYADIDGAIVNEVIKDEAESRIDTSSPVKYDFENTFNYLSSGLFKAPQAALRDVKNPQRIAKDNEIRTNTFVTPAADAPRADTPRPR